MSTQPAPPPINARPMPVHPLATDRRLTILALVEQALQTTTALLLLPDLESLSMEELALLDSRVNSAHEVIHTYKQRINTLADSRRSDLN